MLTSSFVLHDSYSSRVHGAVCLACWILRIPMLIHSNNFSVAGTPREVMHLQSPEIEMLWNMIKFFIWLMNKLLARKCLRKRHIPAVNKSHPLFWHWKIFFKPRSKLNGKAGMWIMLAARWALCSQTAPFKSSWLNMSTTAGWKWKLIGQI